MLDWLNSLAWLREAPWQLWAAVACLVVLAAAIGFVAGRRGRRSAPPPPAPPPGLSTGAVQPSVVVDRGVERLLIRGLVSVHDLAAEHPGIRVKAEQVLRQAGVSPVYAVTGEPFDPVTQEAVAREPVPSGRVPNTVAWVVRPGWRGGGVDYRPTEVTVWTR